MPKGPDVVIIARHGARLDAADKTWHLTSPTPYDPPLTYGGWTQARALGLRIASQLHERDLELENSAKINGIDRDLAHLHFSPLDGEVKNPHSALVDGIPKPKKKRRIVIHTSPFLRCVQTSTAVAAGISQYQPPTSSPMPPQAKAKGGLYGHSSLSQSTTTSSSPAVQPVDAAPAADPKLEVFPKAHKQKGPEKILLRIDAFLGEWLSPDYYEDITPPPNSTMMVAGAKADLLRRGDYIEFNPSASNSHGHFPGGWVMNAAPSLVDSRKNMQDGNFPTLGSLAQFLPRERSNSQGSASSIASRTLFRDTQVNVSHQVPDHVYNPPVPSYAVSPADPIPRGYFAHARNACVDVDFQWDSMREPQHWGDGGVYGDEWSTMHKRFRRGLSGMIHWYKEYGVTIAKDKFLGFIYNPLRLTAARPVKPAPAVSAAQDDEEELVVVLITHGAGCNALIGAMTNQPVLLDVGMASLSMAVRKDAPRRSSYSNMPFRRHSVIDIGLSDEYEMKIMASVDHLRPGIDPSKPLQALTPAPASSPSLENRRRTGSRTAYSPVDSPISIGQPWRSVNSSLGSIRRTSTSGSAGSVSTHTGFQTPSSPSGGGGLWGSNQSMPARKSLSDEKPAQKEETVSHSSKHHVAPSTTTSASTTRDTKPSPRVWTSMSSSTAVEETDAVAPLRKPVARTPSTSSTSSQGMWAPKPRTASSGLWGPPRLDECAERAPGFKRRWTIAEREDGVMR